MHSPAANLGPSFSAPSLLLLPLLPLLPLLAPWPLVRARAEDPLCQPSLSIPLERAKVRGFENGSLLHEGLVYPPDLHWIADGSIRGCVCRLRACLRKCCEDREILGEGDRPECVELPEGGSPPDLRLEEDQLGPEIRHVGQLRERFLLLNDKTCPGMSYILEPEDYEDDEFVLQANGTLLSAGAVLPQWAYCLDWQESSRRIAVLVCVLPGTEPSSENEQVVFHIGMAVSVPFLFLTFLIYAIIPELRNLYGKTLMCYVACLVLAYAFLVLANYVYLGPALCHCVAFVIHFSFLASFFWLNVMCFDIWWTFGGFRSPQGSVKQRERKKFTVYSIYAWGSASVLTGVCLVMDFAPGIPEHFIRPQFGERSCWFTTDAAKAIYFYGPMGVTVVCNICLFVSTALKILRHKQDTARHLKGTDSRRHDDNKQWFNLYLKLFIVMGINWSMEIVSWLCQDAPAYVWYITDLTNTLQGLIIFLIFVWKEKIKRLLLKRLGCRSRGVLSRNSTRSVYHSSASRTCTTSAATLQERINPYAAEASYRAKPLSEESDCA